MGFETTESIQSGDWILVYHSRQQITSEIVTPGKEIQSRYGCFRHADMVGKPWGTKLSSTNDRGFVYLLKPTPELWTLALPHRTQILYLPDIAFITSYLDVKPGSQIIEAGTGSGSFSHSLARTVGKQGKVHSFEYHEERFGKARDEFKQHGLDDVITIKHQNVYKDGFDGLTDHVDSVFLDLPAPWEALGHAKQAMRKDRQARICCFSPCIEQVIRTCSALAEMGFSDITMYETLTRTHDPAPVSAPPISSAIDRIRNVEAKKERRREGQIEDAKRKREEKKRKADEAAAAEAAKEGGMAEEAGEGEDKHTAKRTKFEENGGDEKMVEDVSTLPTASSAAPSSTASPAPSALPATTTTATTDSSASAPPSRPDTPVSRSAAGGQALAAVSTSKEDRELTAKVGAYSRGHTSFLTFATLLPRLDAKEEEKPAAVEVKGEEEKTKVEEEKTKVEEEKPVLEAAAAPVVAAA
ncbi:hypothetical protein JCM8547_007295 [Rhodosporidiobolus lusitaniae]